MNTFLAYYKMGNMFIIIACDIIATQVGYKKAKGKGRYQQTTQTSEMNHSVTDR